MPPDAFDPWAMTTGRIQALEDRLGQMDAELTRNVELAGNTHHAVASLTREVGQMTETFRDFRNALYGVAAIILASAVLVVLLGHP